MQQLKLEAAWDKTISKKDRDYILQTFESTNSIINNGVTFTTLWQAINHKNELLVTALVHNNQPKPLVFRNSVIHYRNEKELIAKHTFTLPALTITPFTSTPWSFIFPNGACHHPKFVELDGWLCCEVEG